MVLLLSDMTVHVLTLIASQLPWQCLLRTSTVDQEWRALLEMDHVWGCQWLRTFGSEICQRSTFDKFDRSSFRRMCSVQNAARQGQHIDMVGSWRGGGVGAGYEYGVRLHLRAEASLWKERDGETFYDGIYQVLCPHGK